MVASQASRLVILVNELRKQLGDWSRASGPLYARLASRLTDLIDEGVIPPGGMLPSERALAEALSVSRRTTEAAYDQLRSSGRVASASGCGTWSTVSASSTDKTSHLRDSALHVQYLSRGRSATIDLSIAALPAHPLIMTARDEVRPFVVSLQIDSHGYDVVGLEFLRAEVAAWFEMHGVPTTPEQIMISHGTVHGLWLAAQLLPRGSDIWVEQPIAPSVLMALRGQGRCLRPTPIDDGGLMIPDINGPCLTAVVVTPAYQNPTGVCLSASRQRKLSRLARTGHVVIIENLALLDMRLEGAAPGTIAALAPDGDVVSAGSMSKLFWGGLRVGWLRAPKHLMSKLAQLRGASDLGVAVDAQAQAAWLLRHREEVLQDRVPLVRQQRNAMAEALTELLPQFRWKMPLGGLSFWVELPESVSQNLFQMTLREGLTLLPSSEFNIQKNNESNLRLPYVHDPDSSRRAMAVLAGCYQKLTSGF
ncbi:MAG: PLP-dependent aminotransferase family protein [Pseudonocardiaceae bacterium]